MKVKKIEYAVSIIVPVYNAENYLKEMFESVRRQSMGFENIQLIMVDDCSKDSSFKLMQSWAEKYPNVVALQTPYSSGSASMPRNIGLAAAEAAYIMFLDADDILRPNAAELLHRLITTHDVDLAGAAFKELGSRESKDKRYVGCREGLFSIRDDADALFPISHPILTKIYKRSIIEQNGISFDIELRNGEDSVFIYRYLQASKMLWHTNEVIYEYRVLENSVSHNRSANYFIELAEACTVLKEMLSGTDVFVYYERFVSEVAVASVDILCDSNQVSDEKCLQILSCWYPHIKYIADNGLNTKVAIGEILARDASRNDYEGYVADFFSLRKLYEDRRELVNRFTASRGWKLLTFANKLLGRG